MKKTILLAFCLLGAWCAQAQELRVKVDYGFLFNNLEGSLPYSPTSTFVGMNLVPAVGVQYKNHSLVAGVSLLEQFGTKKVIDNIEPQIYYQYKDNRFNAAVGAFPRLMLKKYPLAYFTTAKRFVDNTITGVVGQYQTKKGYLEFWMDWYKSDVAQGVDRFLITASGERWWGGSFINGSVMYNHVADQPYFQDFTVFDRLQFTLNAGYDFARHQSVFDELKLSAGVLGDVERRRDDNKKGLEPALGFQTEQTISWKGLSLYNNLYVGKAQMPYYEQYGGAIYFGSPFYQSAFQDYMILSYNYKYKWLTLKAMMIFYFTDKTTANQQVLGVDFNLDELIGLKKKKK